MKIFLSGAALVALTLGMAMAAPAAQAQSGCGANDIQCVALAIHNGLRTDAPAMTWDASLASDAQRWADNRVDSDVPVAHDPNLPSGVAEHMSAGGSPASSGEGAPSIANRIEAWLSSAHRGGMVDPSNVRLGCGTATKEVTVNGEALNRRVVVCRYGK